MTAMSRNARRRELRRLRAEVRGIERREAELRSDSRYWFHRAEQLRLERDTLAAKVRDLVNGDMFVAVDSKDFAAFEKSAIALGYSVNPFWLGR